MLIKKELMPIPLLPVPNLKPKGTGAKDYLVAVDVLDLPRSGSVLIADLYRGKDKSFAARFLSDGNIYYTCLQWPPTSWTKCNPAVSYWYNVQCASTASALETTKQFFGKKERDSYRTNGALAVIDAFISEKVTEKTQREEDNRAALQKAHFEMFPALPTDIEEFCEDQVFDHTYIFFDKLTKTGRRYGRCGHCGKKYQIPKGTKQNEETECPKCGKAAQYKATWCSGGTEDKAKICIAENVDDQLLLRWANVRRQFSGENFKVSYQFEDYAYNLYLTDKKGRQTIYAYEYKTIPYYYGKVWKRWANGTQNFSTAFIYSNNLDTVFGEKYYNVNLKQGLTNIRQPLCFTSLLNNLKKHPEAEYLFKLNMPLLAAEAGVISQLKKGRKPGFSEVLGVSKQLLPLYRDMGVTYSEHRMIQSYGGWVSPEELADYRKLKLTLNDLSEVREMLQMMSLGKFVRYFGKQRAATRRKTHFLMIQYRDYISMVKSLKTDLTRKSVRFPSNICEAHDMVLKEFNELKFEKENAAFVKAVKTVYEKLSVKEWENEQFCIVLPQLRSDLVTEGSSLKHCVGGTNYAENHMKGTSMIFFIRRVTNREKPYFTMQLDMNPLRIVQIHGFGNCYAPPEVRKFVDSFVKALKAETKDNKRRKTA